MPRKVIPLVTGEKYHIYNRGVDKRDVFLDSLDYIRFYQSLAFFNRVNPIINYKLAKSGYSSNSNKLVKIYAYSLLQNHYHVILEQLTDGGISEFMKRVSVGYTGYFNDKNKRSGALFQGNYKKVHIDSDEQYNYLFAYVNENHFVHNSDLKREICHSSSLHYQRSAHSKLIQNIDILYDFKANVLLAKDIYKKRTDLKNTLE